MTSETAVGYLRLSQDGTSLARQRRDVEAYADTNHYTLAEIYNEGTRASGFDTDRPEYQALLDHIETGAIDVVLVPNLSRVSRDRKERLRLLLDVDAAGDAVHSVELGRAVETTPTRDVVNAAAIRETLDEDRCPAGQTIMSPVTKSLARVCMSDDPDLAVLDSLPPHPLSNEAVNDLGESAAAVATMQIECRFNDVVTEFLLYSDTEIYALAFNPEAGTWQLLESRPYDREGMQAVEEALMDRLYDWRHEHVISFLVENDLIPAFKL